MNRWTNVILGLLFLAISLFVVHVTLSQTGPPEFNAQVERDTFRIQAVKNAVDAIFKYSHPNHTKIGTKPAPEKLGPDVLSEFQYETWVDPITKEHFGYKRTGEKTYEITMDFELRSLTIEQRGVELRHAEFVHRPGKHTMKFTTDDHFDEATYWYR